MKISDMKIQLIKRDVESMTGHDIAHAGTSFLSGLAEVPIVRLLTDEGIEGISCGRVGRIAAMALQTIRPVLLGKNPLYIEQIWQKIWEMDRIYQWPPSVLGTVDVAIWDIIGKAANMPLFQLFGAYRDKIRMYASAMQHPGTEDYVREALECKQRGYTAYKIHAHGGPQEHIAVCRAVREAVGQDMILMLDALGVYDRNQALMVGRELERLGFHWFEEPIPDTDMDGLIQLSNALDIPVLTLEILAGNLYSRAPYVSRGAGDMIRSGTIWNGGITPLRKTMALAEAFGINCEIHVSGNPWMSAANLHVACASKNCEFFEQLIPESFWSFGVKQDFKRDNESYI